MDVDNNSVSFSWSYQLFSVPNIWYYFVYALKTGESSSPGLEVKAAHLGDHEFRVQADGVSMDVSLALYSKVNLVTRVYLQIPSIKCNETICLLSLAALYVFVCLCFV